MKKKKTSYGKEKLSALSKISSIVESLQNFDEMMERLAKLVAGLAEAQVCSIYLVDPERRELVLRATQGLNKKLIGRIRVRFGEGYIGKAAEKREEIFVEGTKKRPKRKIAETALKDTLSFLVMPLVFQDKLIGVLDLQYTIEHEFSKKDRELLLKLVKEITILIRGAQLFDETKRGLLEHQLLYRIGLLLTSAEDIEEILNAIVQSAIHILGIPAGSLALYDGGREEFYLAVSMGFSSEFSRVSKWKLRPGGLTSKIIHGRIPLAIPDVSLNPAFDNSVMIKEGIKSLIAVPLIAENKIVGILYVDDFVPREFTTTDISILALLGSQATVALIKAQLLEKTKKLAITDGLTGVFNHRYFQERLDEEIRRTKRYKHPLSLVVLDIDHFKLYNDTYGHPKGDIILERVAKILLNATREVDIVARYGGEEFAVILPETGTYDAIKVAEKIRRNIEKYPFPSEETQPQKKITVSVGVATYPEDADSKEELIVVTDKVMYLAKESGRNRTCNHTQCLDEGKSRRK